MDHPLIYDVPENFVKNTHINAAHYQTLYEQSLTDPEGFWREMGQRIDWIKPYQQIKDVSFAKEDFHIRWYADGTLNVSVNCIDRHLPKRANQTALIFEGDNPGVSQNITYQQLYDAVCRFANLLKRQGVKKGDRVTLYMPMIPEAVYAMLACCRIGAIHSVVFGGFSPDALAGRLIDCDSHVVITADEGRRGGRTIPLKANVDEALSQKGVMVKSVIVVRTGDNDEAMTEGRDIDYHSAVAACAADCPPEEMNAEDPLFILYTSGSTGKPKGVLHTTGGYLVYVNLSFEMIFDYKDAEVFWCTADVGWVTGHSYVVYGPLSNGGTSLIFEGIPTYPDAARFWQICEKHKVNIFYTAPTALRTLMGAGDSFVTQCDLSSIRLLGSVGEPINPEAWHWYYHVVGAERCPIVDTWWQTETGGIMISPFPGATKMKPGSASVPFFGIKLELVDRNGQIKSGAATGNLCITDSWPAQMRTVYGDHDRFYETYFSTYPGKYFTGDGCRRDEDGYYWITGRVDDVINVSGHRMGTAEVESALVAHDHVAEAAVVGFPHHIKGQGIYAYVTLMGGQTPSETLAAELKKWVRQEIGPVATPDHIQFTPALPKTRSGKIMRRILRKVAAHDYDSLGDISTLADPTVVQDIIDNRPA